MLSILCDSNRSISIGSGAAGVWPACSPRRCRATVLSAKHGCSATEMTIRAVLPMDPSKGRPSLNSWTQFPEQVMGKLAGRFRRFPLLLKFLDAREMLSVQVHPADTRTDLLPAGETGKTEAWVVLEAGPKSRIYAGLKPGTTEAGLRQALANGGAADHLACFTPKPGDAVFLPAGTVHALGGDIVVFEVQQNSDVTFRLYDWDHVDAKTGQPRALQVDQALACIDFAEGPVGLVAPVAEADDAGGARTALPLQNTSGCGACAANRRLPSAPRVCRCVGMYRRRRPDRARRRHLCRQKRRGVSVAGGSSECVRFGRAAQ